MDYLGYECPVCKKAFHLDDDIVVCPECGTPHHRECYNSLGHCCFEEKHGRDFEFDTDKTNDSSKDDTIKCRICGFENKSNSLFCSHCGNPMQNQQSAQNPGQQFNQYYGQQMPNTVVFSTVNDNEELEQGVTVGECTKFVQASAPYYVQVFRNIKNFGKSRFNFSAFLLSGGYLLYRKNYKRGAVITAIMIVLMLVTSIIYLSPEYDEVAQMLYDEMGVITSGSYSDFAYIYEFVQQLSQKQLFLIYLPSVLQIIQYAVMFYVGFTANRTYYNHCIKSIKNIKETVESEAQKEEMFKAKGGVNYGLALSVVITFAVISILPYFIIY